MAERVTVKRAAELLGISAETVRFGIKNGELNIGSAIKVSEYRTIYHISPYLLAAYTGKSVEEVKGVHTIE